MAAPRHQTTLPDLPLELLYLIADQLPLRWRYTGTTVDWVLSQVCSALYHAFRPRLFGGLGRNVRTEVDLLNFVKLVHARPGGVSCTSRLWLNIEASRLWELALPSHAPCEETPRNDPHPPLLAGSPESPCLGSWFLFSFSLLKTLWIHPSMMAIAARELPIDPGLFPMLTIVTCSSHLVRVAPNPGPSVSIRCLIPLWVQVKLAKFKLCGMRLVIDRLADRLAPPSIGHELAPVKRLKLTGIRAIPGTYLSTLASLRGCQGLGLRDSLVSGMPHGLEAFGRHLEKLKYCWSPESLKNSATADAAVMDVQDWDQSFPHLLRLTYLVTDYPALLDPSLRGAPGNHSPGFLLPPTVERVNLRGAPSRTSALALAIGELQASPLSQLRFIDLSVYFFDRLFCNL